MPENTVCVTLCYGPSVTRESWQNPENGFLLGIIGEPLAGQRAFCPAPVQTEVALVVSPVRAIDAPVRRHLLRTDLGRPHRGHAARAHRAVADMVAALGRTAGPQPTGLIDWARPRGDHDGTRLGRPGSAPAGPAAWGLARPRLDSIIAMHLAETRRSPG